MKENRKILRGHYVSLLRKVATWTGLAALLSTTFVAMPASAYVNQVTPRSATLNNSKAGATVDVTVGWTSTAGNYLTKGIKVQMCDSPLQTTACAASNSSSFAGATLTGQSGISGFTIDTAGATSFTLNKVAGTTLNATAVTVTIHNLTLPNTANTEFYFRVTTYGDTTYGTPDSNGEDYGAIADSTGTEVTVAANVQESLQLNVGSTGTCGSIAGSSVNIGNNPGTDNVLQIGTATAGTSVMCVNTNAAGGYAIQYVSNSAHNNAFTNGTYDLTDASGGGTFANPVTNSTDFFGMNLVQNSGENSGPTIGSNESGGTSPTIDSPYGTAGQFAFAHGAATTVAHETTGPTTNALFTVSYAAIAGASSKTGAYQVKLNYIATGTF